MLIEGTDVSIRVFSRQTHRGGGELLDTMRVMHIGWSDDLMWLGRNTNLTVTKVTAIIHRVLLIILMMMT